MVPLVILTSHNWSAAFRPSFRPLRAMIVNSAATPALLSEHAVHLLSIGIPLGLLLVGLALDSWRKRRARRTAVGARRRKSLRVAAAACAGAALVHLVVMPQHFHEYWLFGTFFAVAAGAQLGAAWLLAFRPARPLVAAVALGSAAVICLWLVTRVIGLPVGPEAGATEAVGPLDVLASACELVVVLACVVGLRAGRPPEAPCRVDEVLPAEPVLVP